MEISTTWQFLTNHTHVLLAIRRNPEIRQREIADLVGITEGAVQRIITELETAKCLTHERVGRRNHCLLYTSPSPRDRQKSRMPSSA